MNSINYEDRFEGLLPKEAFPLPLPGHFQKRPGPPTNFDKLLTLAEQILSGQPNVQWTMWPRTPGPQSRGIMSIAIKSELAASCGIALINLRHAAQDGQTPPNLDDLRTMVDMVKVWDVSALAVKAYRKRVELKKWLTSRGWKDPAERGSGFDGLVSMSHVGKIIQIEGA